MKFRISLEQDSGNSYLYSTDLALEVETVDADLVELTLESPHRKVKIKKSELRYALAFCGTVEDH